MSSLQDKKAFVYEDGLFVCHIYAKLSESDVSVLSRISEKILLEQRAQPSCQILRDWQTNLSNDNHQYHLTLLRGHKAVYYQQIKPLVSSLQKLSKQILPFSVYLDTLRIFHNHEGTKQFLCLASKPMSQPDEIAELRRGLENVVKKIVINLTTEEETEDTVAHCSLLFRTMRNTVDVDGVLVSGMEQYLAKILAVGEAVYVRVETLFMKVGNKEYKFELTG